MNRADSEEKRRHSSGLVPYSYYKCRIPDYFANVPLHWHTEFELNVILSGRAEFICGEKKFTSEEGDIILIPPNVLHAIYPVQGFSQLYDTVVFSPDMIGARDSDRCAAECIRPIANGSFGIDPRITAEHIYYGELKTTAENIISCAKGNSPRLDMLFKSELLRLFWLLYESGDIYPENETSAKQSEMIRPALELMNTRYFDNITIEMLAASVHLSSSYFMGCFKRYAGVGAMEYLGQIRIKKACELLSERDISVADTAYECGYRNISNFNRQFKKAVGCTASEYRKRSRTDR